MSEGVFVVVDSSAVRATGPTSLVARVLRESAKRGDITVYVSTIVEQEVATGLAADLPELDGLTTWVPDGEKKRLQDLFSKASESLAKLPKLIEAGVRDWFDSMNAVRLPIAADHAEKAFALYFQGKPPFKTRKNRQDLPDAFIYLALRDLATSASKPIHVVVKDGALANACARVPLVTTHESFIHLFKTLEITPEAESTLLGDYCKEKEHDLLGRVEQLLPDRIRDLTLLLSFQGHAQIVAPGEVRYVDFDMSDRYYFPGNVVVIPFHAGLDRCTVELDATKETLLRSLHIEGSAIVEFLVGWQDENLRIAKVEVDDLDATEDLDHS